MERLRRLQLQLLRSGLVCAWAPHIAAVCAAAMRRCVPVAMVEAAAMRMQSLAAAAREGAAVVFDGAPFAKLDARGGLWWLRRNTKESARLGERLVCARHFSE